MRSKQEPRAHLPIVWWPYPLRDDELADSFTETLKTQTSEAGCVVFAERTGNGFVSARTAGDVADEHLLRLASVLAAKMYASWDESDPITVSFDDRSFEASVAPGPQPWVVRVHSRARAAG
jgi:hypothetical protein